MSQLTEMFSANSMEKMADITKAQKTLSDYRRDGYDIISIYENFHLMMIVDKQESGATNKYFWEICAPDGEKHDLTITRDSRGSFSYHPPTFRQFVVMVEEIKKKEKDKCLKI